MRSKIDRWRLIHQRNAGEAWLFFLENYNPAILRILTHLASDYDQKMDSYTYILENLKAHDCRKIRTFFDKNRAYPFERWLAVVVRNCYLDWIRKINGRKRPPAKVGRLAETEKTIYRLVFEKRIPIETAFDIMTSNGGINMSFGDFVAKIEKIGEKAGITASAISSHAMPGMNKIIHYDDAGITIQLRDDTSPPDACLIQQEDCRNLHDILDKLTPQEQLILKLHFIYNRTLSQICGSLKISSIWKAHRILKKAIDHVNREVKKRKISYPEHSQEEDLI